MKSLATPAKTTSPLLESYGKVLIEQEMLKLQYKEVVAENEVFSAKAEKQRQRERAAQVRYQKRYRQEHPEEAKVKEREKKRRYRANKKKKLEAQQASE